MYKPRLFSYAVFFIFLLVHPTLARTAVKALPKSTVVKEIKRIQQRREERRAAHQKVREAPEYEAGAINHEFVSMIK